MRPGITIEGHRTSCQRRKWWQEAHYGAGISNIDFYGSAHFCRRYLPSRIAINRGLNDGDS
jgi:hypothetical protein